MRDSDKALVDDLARTIQQSGGQMVWTHMPLGSVWHDGPGIADVVALSKSYTINLRIYEVKRSRADFWHDVNSGKYLKYLAHCTQFYFAVPKGLIKLDELPAGCGLITKGDKSWRVQRAAPRNECEYTPNLFMALLMRGFQDFWAARPSFAKGVEWFDYQSLSDAAFKYGKQYAMDLARGEESTRKAAALKEEIDTVVGKKSSDIQSAVWALSAMVDRLLNKYKYAEEISKITDILQRLFAGSLYGVDRDLKEVLERVKSAAR